MKNPKMVQSKVHFGKSIAKKVELPLEKEEYTKLNLYYITRSLYLPRKERCPPELHSDGERVELSASKVSGNRKSRYRLRVQETTKDSDRTDARVTGS